MKVEFERDVSGKVRIELIAENPVEEMSLKQWSYDMVNSHSISLGEYLNDCGGSETPEKTSIILKSYVEDSRQARLGIDCVLRRENNKITAGVKIKKRK